MKSKHWMWGVYAGLLLSFIGGFLVHLYSHPKIHFFWETLPFFSALYGFVGCILIVIGSKALGHWWLQKKEDYYEEQEQMRSEN